jgi:hypothetical protein
MSELNPIAAATTAALSSVIGLGLAFYIAAKINKGMLSQSQKVLVYVAMTSFGVGLTGILNEIIGLPLQGLSIRGEKVYQYVLANIFTVPMLLGIAYLLKSRSKHSVQTANVATSSPVQIKSKSSASIIGLGIAAFIGCSYALLEVFTTPVFEAYAMRNQLGACIEKPEENPAALYKFVPKNHSNEVMVMVKGIEKGERQNYVLDDCKIFNPKNWKCGGEIKSIGTRVYIDSSYEMIDGNSIIYSRREPYKDRDCGAVFRKAGLITALMF